MLLPTPWSHLLLQQLLAVEYDPPPTVYHVYLMPAPFPALSGMRRG